MCQRSIFLSSVLLFACLPFSAFGGFSFAATADSSNAASSGLGVRVEGFVEFNDAANQIVISVFNNDIGVEGFLYGIGFNFLDGISTPNSGVISMDDGFGPSSIFDGVSADSFVDFYYDEHTNANFNLNFFDPGLADPDFFGVHNGGNPSKGLDPNTAKRFYVDLIGAGSAASLADVLDLDASYQLAFRFQDVSSPGGSTKMVVGLNSPVPEPSVLIMGITGVFGVLLIARRRR